MIPYGTIVESELWPEPVQVFAYQLRSDGDVHIVGTLVNSQGIINQELTPEEAATLKVVNAQIEWTAEARHAFLCLEAKRYRYAALYAPTLAVSVSKVDPLPHQIEAVWQVLKQTRIRFLIADDPGAGKTIMAGLIAKELKLRNQAQRILIVAPGHLVTQWIHEMKSRFEESFTEVTRAYVNAHSQENVWIREPQLITSIDFARQDDIRAAIANAHFDLVIVDEAHKMAAYQYGDKIERTKRYQLGECLSRQTTHLLFLTATPHRGDSENFRLFLDLLEPGFFADAAQIRESIQRQDNPLFIRRIKEELKDFEGKPLFLPRHIKTHPFQLGVDSESEMSLYNALSDYIREQYNRFSEDSQKRNNVAFALVILQRRLASSTQALCLSLQRRKQRLMELLQKAAAISSDILPNEQAREEAEDREETERWELEEQWEVLSVAENREELEEEIETLNRLERDARQIIDRESELKLKALRAALDELNREYPNQKILIFTEYFDTLDYLEQKVKAWGFSVSVIHGKMPHEQRIAAQETFRNETQLLLATEAAGEGINLQFCHLMLNYDLPWNPNRLEQRMGRIHRYGQKNEVHVINLVSTDTREGAVFNRLFDKLETIRAELGSDRVYDVIGELFPKKNLAQLILEAATNARGESQTIVDELETTLDEARFNFLKEFNQDTLVSPFINLPEVKFLQQQAREHGLIPEYTREFFRKAFETLGGELRLRRDGFFTIPRIPSEIWRIVQKTSNSGRRALPVSISRRDLGAQKLTFDKAQASEDSTAEFISFGHPLFEAVIQWAEQTLADALKTGACFEDPGGKYNGVIAFYEGEIRDGADAIAGKRLFAFYLPENGGDVKTVNPTLLWDFQEAEPTEETGPMERADLEAAVGAHPRQQLEAYRQEQMQERQRQVDIKRRYGVASLERLIIELDGELLKLDIRSNSGEDVALVRRNKEEQKIRYEEEKVRLEKACQQEVTLSRKSPTLAGAIRVRPAADADASMKTAPDIERVGMKEATRYEEAQGNTVEDISAENLGFDLRSTTSDGTVRCIEVKARAGREPVVLTRNEWHKAKQLKDAYYLYVVFNAAAEPELHRIQNPAERLPNVRPITEVRYQVSVSEIVGHGTIGA